MGASKESQVAATNLKPVSRVLQSLKKVHPRRRLCLYVMRIF
jgi:hypothetical protein